jgi:hypothetical protein
VHFSRISYFLNPSVNQTARIAGRDKQHPTPIVTVFDGDRKETYIVCLDTVSTLNVPYRHDKVYQMSRINNSATVHKHGVISNAYQDLDAFYLSCL